MAQISGSTLPGIIEHLLIRPLPEQKTAANSHMSIAICYPSIGRSDVDTDIRQWAADIADAFERNFDYEILTAEMGENSEAGLSQNVELAADYSVSRPSSKALSITFHLWNYVGGPHANLDVVTLNYSLINGQRLQLVDLFKKPDEALRLMSEWSRAFLDQRYGTGRTQMLLRGTEPSVENFSSLTLTPSGISINFQPYQVAAWEMGAQTVEMPLEALAGASPLTVFWER
ncbi:MAG: RsiV family protein [Desulfovibrio sp.]|nr:RsiV family protein [Desulfovibrio sp.]